jgi:phosphoribosylanthranilate isomerase
VIRVKICGINDAVGFDATVSAGADWLGFVFFAGSPRAVTPAQAAALSARHHGGPLRVGLFVEPSDDDVAAALAAVRLDVLQLYVPAARAAELRGRFGLPVWRAAGVAEARELPADGGGVDGFVIEAKAPPGATRPGGNAVALDWSLLAGWRAKLPWLLAGGLTADNVAGAIVASGAAAVDVSSGVERARGVKDVAMIQAFVAAARTAGAARAAV